MEFLLLLVLGVLVLLLFSKVRALRSELDMVNRDVNRAFGELGAIRDRLPITQVVPEKQPQPAVDLASPRLTVVAGESPTAADVPPPATALPLDLDALLAPSASEPALLPVPNVPASSPADAAIVPPSPLGAAPKEVLPVRPWGQMASAPPRKPARSKQEWEALVGGKILNRVGALALVIGVGFFFKYAVDQNWIGPTLRVALGLLAGFALLGGGERFHRKKLQMFAQGLTGAGISVLYLSCFACFNFYHLVPQMAAFGMMSGVTALTMALAFRYDSLGISLIGWGGGFLTPFMLSAGEANAPGLFTYIVLLDIGLLAALVKKEAWYVLEPLTFGATALIYAVWALEYFREAEMVTAALFVTAVWLLFHALEIIHIVRNHTKGLDFRAAISSANAVGYYAALYFAVYPNHPAAMGVFSLVIAAVYVVSFLQLKKAAVTFGAQDQARFTVCAVVLVIIGTAIYFRHDPFVVVACWSGEAALIAWFGIRQRIAPVWQAALAVLALSLLRFAATPGAFAIEAPAEFTLLFNWRAFALLSVAASAGASIVIFKKLEHPAQVTILTALRYSWPAVIFGLITIESHNWYLAHGGSLDTTPDGIVYRDWFTLALVWAAYAVAFIAAGSSKKIASMIDCGVIAGILATIVGCSLGFSFVPIERFAPALNLRAVALALLAAAAYGAMRFIDRPGDAMPRTRMYRVAMYSASAVALFVLATGETMDVFRQWMIGASDLQQRSLEYHQLAALAIVWTGYACALGGAGVRAKSRLVVTFGVIASLLPVCTALVFGWAYRPVESFALLGNVRVLALVAVLAGLWVQSRFSRMVALLDDWQGVLRIVLRSASVVVALALVTGEVRDQFELAKIGSTQPDLLDYRQWSALIIAWAACAAALGVVAARTKRREETWSGVGLMAVATLAAIVHGFAFEPIGLFEPIINARFLEMLATVGALAVYAQWQVAFDLPREVAPILRSGLRIAVMVVLFTLVTGETRDYFAFRTFEIRTANPADAAPRIAQIENLSELMLSSAWLVYSIALMTFGFIRRVALMRISAIALFGVTILKIFLYDLSFLESLYRIFSFIGLGVILLVASYLYTKYKSHIFGGDEVNGAAEESGGGAHNMAEEGAP